MKLIILLMTLPLSAMTQRIVSVKTDTIAWNAAKYLTCELKINSNSASDAAKVFIAAIENFDTLKILIPKYYFARKQEYNEYYILGVPDMTQTSEVEKALTKFLNKIDSARALRSRSTFRRIYTWDNANRNINYQPKYKQLSQIDNIFYLKWLNDICKYMTCPHQRLRAQ